MNYEELIERFSRELPSFDDGRIDYSDSNEAPVVTVFVQSRGSILLLKRSQSVLAYQGKWNAIAGYIDEKKPLKAFVLQELREEIQVGESLIVSLKEGTPYTLADAPKTWYVFPVLVTLRSPPEIVLDEEHTDFTWVAPEKMNMYDVVPGLEKSWEQVTEVPLPYSSSSSSNSE